MASLEEKIQCEAHMRELLEQEGMPQQDAEEYGYGCIRLFFNEPRVALVVDIDDYTEVDEARARRLELEKAIDEPPAAEREDQDRGPPFTLFPNPGPAQMN
jgi:hypothetical protein